MKLHDLPPKGTALRKIGARLSELLEEHQWSECEDMLFDVADEHKASLEDKTDLVIKALRTAWELGQTYWQQADSEFISQHRKSDLTYAKFVELIDATRAEIVRTE